MRANAYLKSIRNGIAMQSENNYQNTVSTAVDVKNAKVLSPKRNTTKAETTEGLVEEQLSHFGIDASSEYGPSFIRRPCERDAAVGHYQQYAARTRQRRPSGIFQC